MNTRGAGHQAVLSFFFEEGDIWINIVWHEDDNAHAYLIARPVVAMNGRPSVNVSRNTASWSRLDWLHRLYSSTNLCVCKINNMQNFIMGPVSMIKIP